MGCGRWAWPPAADSRQRGTADRPSPMAYRLLVAPLRWMNLVEHQGFLVQPRTRADTLEFPGCDIRVVLVVAERLTIGRLALLAEVTTARFLALECVERAFEPATGQEEQSHD